MNREVREYIGKQISRMEKDFNGIEIRYAYDENTDFHVIEVLPESVRRGNMKFVDFEYNMILEFEEMFPDEEFVITEPCVLTQNIPTIYSTKKAKEVVQCQVAPKVNFFFNIEPHLEYSNSNYSLAS